MPDMQILAYFALLIAASACIGGILDYKIAKHHIRHISPRNAVAILGGRGAVGVIIGEMAFSSGIISGSIYSVIIFGTIVLSLLMPSMMRLDSRMHGRMRTRLSIKAKAAL